LDVFKRLFAYIRTISSQCISYTTLTAWFFSSSLRKKKKKPIKEISRSRFRAETWNTLIFLENV